MQDRVYDFIGIGLGPFNLSLACLTEPLDGVSALFLDKNEGFNWHPGMLLHSSTMQTPFLADMVTLADPTSRYSFLSYLKSIGRLYSFYIKEDFFVMRREFNQYCQWVASELSNLRFNRYVERVDDEGGVYAVHSVCTKSGTRHVHRARRLVLGTGTTPYLPACCSGVADRAAHTASYLNDKPELQGKRSITVVGSGQSAAEIYYDLLQEQDQHGYQLDWLTRAPRFFPLEYAKLTLEMTSPEYIDYFHALPPGKRDALIDSQKGLYKGINLSTINEIFDLLYNKRLEGEVATRLVTCAELKRCDYDEESGRFVLDFFQHEVEQGFRHETEALILATGYAYREPAFLKGLGHALRRDARGRLDVARNYTVDHAGRDIFVQNVGLYSHGLVTPDLGMACYRNAYILREMLGREVYPVERRIAFQAFSLDADGFAPLEASAA